MPGHKERERAGLESGGIEARHDLKEFLPSWFERKLDFPAEPKEGNEKDSYKLFIVRIESSCFKQLSSVGVDQ